MRSTEILNTHQTLSDRDAGIMTPKPRKQEGVRPLKYGCDVVDSNARSIYTHRRFDNVIFIERACIVTLLFFGNKMVSKQERLDYSILACGLFGMTILFPRNDMHPTCPNIQRKRDMICCDRNCTPSFASIEKNERTLEKGPADKNIYINRISYLA